MITSVNQWSLTITNCLMARYVSENMPNNCTKRIMTKTQIISKQGAKKVASAAIHKRRI